MSELPNKHPYNRCLCCGQLHYKAGEPKTVAELELEWLLLEQLGYTRETLLRDHRAQLDYQLPGMATWLQGQ